MIAVGAVLFRAVARAMLRHLRPPLTIWHSTVYL
jgi:hypothetical protein